MNKIIFCLLISLCSLNMNAQELLGRLDVSHNQIQGVDPTVFQALERSLNEFINNRKWTNDNFTANEKIECNFRLTLTSKTPNDNIYTATLNIQASRPIFNTSYTSPTVNFQDREVTFKFDESQTLQFSDNSVTGSDPLVSNLTAVFAYYIYLIIGLDYDSFTPQGGGDYLRRAQNVVNNAPEDKQIRGWKSAENNRNRYWLIEQLLNPRFADFRPFWYTYHRRGLDVMYEDPEVAVETIMEGIEILQKLHNDNPNSFLMQFYFNAKSDEWSNLIQQSPAAKRKEFAQELMRIDVTNAAKYRRIN